ncbi:MAG TPA: hypothetical protein VG733_05780, partial [Chthoniobacteraceae bacterium]|nr:hypothetical protein [Chthoniobacteraceae bacterium]
MKTLFIALLMAAVAACAAARAADSDAASQGALASAQQKAAELARRESQAEEDLRAAAAAVKEANSLAQQKAAALDSAKALAAASPGDASLSDAVKKAAAESDDAARAASDAKTAMDAKTAEALSFGERLHAAVKAVADAKTAAEAAAKQAWVQGRLDAAGALAKKSHVAAMVIVDQGGEKSTAFRYDHFPAMERVVTKEGEFFARPAGKAWMASADWGESGVPLPAKRAAELDAMAALAMRALQPVPLDVREGNAVWSPTADPGGYRFVQSRERPLNGTTYPVFEFTDNEKENAGILPREVVAPGDWKGAPAEVTVDYFYMTGEAAPPSASPEAQIL